MKKPLMNEETRVRTGPGGDVNQKGQGKRGSLSKKGGHKKIAWIPEADGVASGPRSV